MLGIVLKTTVTVIVTSLMGYILKELKNINSQNHATKNGMVLILRSQIVGKCEKCIEQGFISDYTRSCLEDLFEEYEKLGGNHGVKALVEQAFSLPPKKM